MSKIPFNGDVNENETVLKFSFNLYSQCKNMCCNVFVEREKVEPHMGNITLTCMKVLVDEKCDEVSEDFKREVGKFVKNVIMVSGEHNLALLRDMEA